MNIGHTEYSGEYFSLRFQGTMPLLGIRSIFGDCVKDVLSQQSKIKKGNSADKDIQKFAGTTNGAKVVNPCFDFDEQGNMSLQGGNIGYFHTYHAHLSNVFSEENEGLTYTMLSSSSIVYNPQTRDIFVFQRPKDSQEDPGQLDVIGGYVEPDIKNYDNGRVGDKGVSVDFKQHVSTRLANKAGLDSIEENKIKFLGVHDIQERDFQDVAFYYEADDSELQILNDNIGKKPIMKITPEQRANYISMGGALEKTLRSLESKGL